MTPLAGEELRSIRGPDVSLFAFCDHICDHGGSGMTSTVQSTSRETSLSSPEAIERWLTDALSSLLEIDPQRIDPHERFTRYGLDSAGALQLVADLGRRLGRSLS